MEWITLESRDVYFMITVFGKLKDRSHNTSEVVLRYETEFKGLKEEKLTPIKVIFHQLWNTSAFLDSKF